MYKCLHDFFLPLFFTSLFHFDERITWHVIHSFFYKTIEKSYLVLLLFFRLLLDIWYLSMYVQGGPKKSLWCDLEEKCLRKSKIFFYGVFLSIYSHLLKKLVLFNFCRKKSYGTLKILEMACSKKVTLSKKETFFFCSFSISVAR